MEKPFIDVLLERKLPQLMDYNVVSLNFGELPGLSNYVARVLVPPLVPVDPLLGKKIVEDIISWGKLHSFISEGNYSPEYIKHVGVEKMCYPYYFHNSYEEYLETARFNTILFMLDDFLEIQSKKITSEHYPINKISELIYKILKEGNFDEDFLSDVNFSNPILLKDFCNYFLWLHKYLKHYPSDITPLANSMWSGIEHTLKFNELRNSKVLFTENTYCEMRYQFSGVLIQMELTMIFKGNAPNERDRYHPDFFVPYHLTSQASSLLNDFFGVKKELGAEALDNYILVKQMYDPQLLDILTGLEDLLNKKVYDLSVFKHSPYYKFCEEVLACFFYHAFTSKRYMASGMSFSITPYKDLI